MGACSPKRERLGWCWSPASAGPPFPRSGRPELGPFRSDRPGLGSLTRAPGHHSTAACCAPLAPAGIRQPAQWRTPVSAAREASRSDRRPEVPSASRPAADVSRTGLARGFQPAVAAVGPDSSCGPAAHPAQGRLGAPPSGSRAFPEEDLWVHQHPWDWVVCPKETPFPQHGRGGARQTGEVGSRGAKLRTSGPGVQREA